MPNVGPLEIIVVLALVLIIFGPKRLPELGHSLGKGIREFRGSLSGENDEPPAAPKLESAADAKPAPVAAQPVAAEPVANQSVEAKPSETSTGS
jgi:sec-independent protein translocase protein TatA